jgi:lipopolysaccharide transport system ATP-binding protein
MGGFKLGIWNSKMSADDIAIKVENLSKCYHVYDKPRDRLLQMLSFGRKQYFLEFWALRDVSFEIKKGEAVGIIGRNGSGKSTLLQMICGTLNPTSGSIQTDGRIAALLELGSGFNPEFTGRENVYMNGALLGLSTEEIDNCFDEIAAFAEIGDFIDQAVKTYSSGMLVRLAFSVAINANPEILVVDEALSVGDELFQRKCFSRIEAIRANGATILFVSHSGGQIVELCDKAILLDLGEKLTLGVPKQVIGRYQKLLYVPAEKRNSVREQIRYENIEKIAADTYLKQLDVDFNEVQEPEIYDELPESFDPNLKPSSTIEYESYGAFIETPMISTVDGEKVNNLIRGRTYCYSYNVLFTRNASNVRFGMLIKTISGIELGGGVSVSSARDSLPFIEPGGQCRVEYKFKCALNPGVYFLNAGVVGDVNGSETFLHRLVDIAMFRVLSESNNLATGIIDFECSPKIELF